jgi:(1->4)-alpha-D-glucan 1-alpha-D-glucosylmutase
MGPDAGGAETWASPGVYALEARVGTPPDMSNPEGRVWPMAPPIPGRLRELGYAPWVTVLRRNMQAAGALRVDRIPALRALLWLPVGGSPADGAWVRYPFEDLLGVLALESHRNRCLVIGEDLDPLPPRLSASFTRTGAISYRLLCLQKDGNGDFPPPADLPEQSQMAFTAPPLPPLVGYWRGLDVDLYDRLRFLFNERTHSDLVVARAQDRARLLVALEREGLLPAGATAHPVSVPEMTPDLVQAVHQYLGRSPATLVTLRLEDIVGQTGELATPGGGEPDPTWRQRLALDLENWGDDERVRRTAEVLRQERGSAANPRVVPGPPPESAPGPTSPEVMVPRATYRLQLHRGFGFEDALARVPYLAALGVSHCYLSPILRARPGSTHGYDIIDHGIINPELGGEAGFERLAAALRAHGMGLVLDLVPNHMGVMGSDNAWWLDVLENGPAAAAASHFDIDWEPMTEQLRAKVLLPTLGDHYGNVLDRGELALAFDTERGEFSLVYYEHRFPVDPREYPCILAPGLGRIESRLGSAHPHLLEFTSLVTAFRHLPPRSEITPERRAERQRDKDLHKRHLARMALT